MPKKEKKSSRRGRTLVFDFSNIQVGETLTWDTRDIPNINDNLSKSVSAYKDRWALDWVTKTWLSKDKKQIKLYRIK